MTPRNSQAPFLSACPFLAGLHLKWAGAHRRQGAIRLFAKVTADSRDRRTDGFDGGIEIRRGNTQPIRPVISLGIVTAVDNRRRPDAARCFRCQNRRDWCKVDHGESLSSLPPLADRALNLPNKRLTPKAY